MRICPVCGSIIEHAPGSTQPHTSYGAYQQAGIATPTQKPEYVSQTETPPHGAANAFFPPQNGNLSPYQNPSIKQGPYPGYRVESINTITIIQKNNAALITEIILSLFGIFGVGWLMAGETTTGIILLICSGLIYWPIMLLGTIFTFGFGLICLGPMAITAIIVNLILLNTLLQKKAMRFVIPQMQPQRMTVPPQNY
ncbi:hypothetical protein [Dictyobacter arantiisoli]|uniref:Uncharacterized protein n=1 Tax=Dictyobacter arantiisoli TaxID=2014874 RepID=A0A5A5TI66_9CHLR|nr:hypothetical protein [Dictyobacter arantiisoli]GCF11087.1 hypothetical protein KDI_46510 [Dictyobacter arantiisoli]